MIHVAYSQGQLIIASGGHMAFNNNAQIVFNNTKFSNSGNFLQGTSTVKIIGNAATANSSIAGNSTTTFHNLEINKSSNDVQLSQNINVENQLTFTNGKFNLGSKKVVLTGTNSALSGEKPASRFINSTSINATADVTRTLNNPNSNEPGKLGAMITALNTNLGSTTISRGHREHTLVSGKSILRFYKITPANSVGGTLRLHYFDEELNGNTIENDLEIWRSTDNGSTWSQVITGTKSNNSTSNWVQRTNIPNLSGLYTIGKKQNFSPGGGGTEGSLTSGDLINDNLTHSPSPIHVFPNPADAGVTIYIQSEHNGQAQLNWYSLDGQLIKKEEIWLEKGENSFLQDLTPLPTGTYLVKCQIEGVDIPAVKVVKN